ncbi:34527_t:CDS:1, partial [Gigaspora margarita]
MRTSSEASMNMKIEDSEWEALELKRLQKELIELSTFNIDDPSSEEPFLISKIVVDKYKPNIFEQKNRDGQKKNKEN